jgi:CheY-like chemotaxis protein
MENHSGTLRVCVVENHQDTLEFLTMYLKKKGHCVSSACDMQSALRILESDPIDVLLCDISLPDGDGIQLMRHLQKNNCLPFGIAMTGHVSLPGANPNDLCGFRHHLLKPFLPEELDRLLDEAFDAIQRECPEGAR